MSEEIINAILHCEDRADRAGNPEEQKSFMLLAREYRKLAARDAHYQYSETPAGARRQKTIRPLAGKAG